MRGRSTPDRLRRRRCHLRSLLRAPFAPFGPTLAKREADRSRGSGASHDGQWRAMSPRNVALLVVGVLAVSCSAPLIRLADAPPFAVALYRNAFAAGILMPLAWIRHRDELRSLSRSDWGLLTVAGAFLALHFMTFIPSVSLTTVAAATVLVSTSAVFAAAGGKVVFGDAARPTTVAGLVIALIGAILISGGDFRGSTRAFLG